MRRRGRPRTGQKPVVPVRLPGTWVKKIGLLAELHGVDRSTALRMVVEIGLDSPQIGLLLRRAGIKGRNAPERVVRIAAAELRAKATQSALTRAPSTKTEINSLRAEEELAQALNAEADRLARRNLR